LFKTKNLIFCFKQPLHFGNSKNRGWFYRGFEKTQGKKNGFKKNIVFVFICKNSFQKKQGYSFCLTDFKNGFY